MTVGLKDLPRSYLPGGGPQWPHSSNVCTEPVQSITCQPGQEAVQDASAKHRASQLDWTTVFPIACLSRPLLTVCTAPWGSPPPSRPAFPQPPKDSLSLIPSVLVIVIKSDLKGHHPIPSCYCSPRTGNDFPKIT